MGFDLESVKILEDDVCSLVGKALYEEIEDSECYKEYEERVLDKLEVVIDLISGINGGLPGEAIVKTQAQAMWNIKRVA